ncbi:sulfite exporter TauE/SafE family protein [Polluticoccus soli]|uniref:sulfite exporter TauE/SafE family protein n=1 Tax=Polluticoccus soli TaxID=3034150 RepID=UPI0023E1CBCF|nr:sulfite exporter TauE/SafE family protein [Flavipsychrobacter sp. JY13-12]
MSIITIVTLLLIGLAAGMLSSLVGIGGGLVIVPSMVLLLGLNQKMAQGTSLALLMLPLGILAVMVYHKAGNVKWSYALIMAVTFVIGSYFGAKLVQDMNTITVKRIFAVFMIIIGIKYLFFDKPSTPPTNKLPVEHREAGQK